MEATIIIISRIILVYFILLGIGYTFLLLVSLPDIFRKFRKIERGNITDLIEKEELVPATVIMPAYNEENRIINAIESVINSKYKNTKLIIVNDGSTDGMMDLLIKRYSMYETPVIVQQKIATEACIKRYYESSKFPNIVIIDKEHSNTGDSINLGLNACRTPIFMTVDADTILEPEAISRIIFTFLSNSHCIAVGGAVYPLNCNELEEGKFIREPHLPQRFVSAIQTLEYIRSFLFGRSGWNAMGGSLAFAGAFTLFETKAVLEVGGYDHNNFSQDCEIVTRLHEYMISKGYPYSIRFTPNAFAWTEVPETFTRFWVQRNHWQRGLMCSFFRHFNMFFNPKYGCIGLFTYPFFIFFEVLCAVVEFTAYVVLAVGLAMGILAWPTILLFIILAWAYAGFLTMATLFVNGITFNVYKRKMDIFRIFALVIFEMLGFRQFHATCKFFGFWHYFFNRLRGKKL